MNNTNQQHAIEEARTIEALTTSPASLLYTSTFGSIEANASVSPDGTDRGISIYTRETDPDPVFSRWVGLEITDPIVLRKFADWFTRAAEWAEQGERSNPQNNNDTVTRVIA